MKSAVTRANVHEAGARVQTAAMNWHAHSSTAKLPNITRSIAKSPEIRGFQPVKKARDDLVFLV